MGRPRKFKNGEVVRRTDYDTLGVIVDHRIRGTKSEYRIVPVNNRIERFGRAAWVVASDLVGDALGRFSSKGTILTYRANEWLDAEIGGRGCDCHCCVHTAQDRSMWNHHTGELRRLDNDS